MMAGLPPFYDTNFQRMYKKILSSPLRFPAHLSRESVDVLTRRASNNSAACKNPAV
jgi:hypothetical protein